MDRLEVPLLTDDDASTFHALKAASGPGTHRFTASLVTGGPGTIEVYVHGMLLGRLDDAISARSLPRVLADGASALTIELPAEFLRPAGS
jgi:hypothetical protein